MIFENKNKYKNGYTKIPNIDLCNSEIPYKARFLYCLLLMHSFGKEECFPSEILLSKEMGISDRYIRKILKVLVEFKLIQKVFRGHNGKSNLYILSKFQPINRNNISSSQNKCSYRVSTPFPVSIGNIIPTNNNQLIIKNNKEVNFQASEGYKKCLEVRNKYSNNKKNNY